MAENRRSAFLNAHAAEWTTPALDPTDILAFHQSFPAYKPTPLVQLPDLAKELQVQNVFIKDESSRFGLPSFKVLGASWGTMNGVAAKLKMQPSTPLNVLGKAASEHSVQLFAATDGNHGRAVAYVARLLGIPAKIYVPSTLEEHVRERIRREGAIIIESTTYDGAVMEAAGAAELEDGVLIQDTAFPGYEEISARIVDGYSTMLNEIDTQLQDLGVSCSHVVCPVGVGSLAEAVTRHYKSDVRPARAKLITVEPDTAACLWHGLHAGRADPIRTSSTIMTGMECGTVSHNAWPLLSQGVDVSLTVSDHEAHQAVQYLDKHGVIAGPCGGGSVAALRELRARYAAAANLDQSSVVVLLNTEAKRDYEMPFDVTSDDPVEVTRILTQIQSTNSSLSASGGTGETQIANYVEAWLQHRNIATHRVESISGRPSIIGVVPGSEDEKDGKSLMINGHIDTVSIATYESDPLGGRIDTRNGKQVILGRGALDMKAGVAAGMCALAYANSPFSRQKRRGQVILAAVADEEHLSQGTQDVIAAGWRADGAVIPEPTGFTLAHAHKGFVWADINILGRASHGSEPSLGIDAIMKSGKVLTALDEYSSRLPTDEDLGQGSLHCGLISGGEEPSSYPASCKITLEFRTVPAQTPESIIDDLTSILKDIASSDKDFSFDAPVITAHRPPHKLDKSHSFVKTVVKSAQDVLGREVVPESVKFWCDAALLGEAGIPAVIIGSEGEGLHAKEEWVDVESVVKTADILKRRIDDWCG